MFNRVFYLLGLWMAVAMIVFTAFLIHERMGQIGAVRLGFWDNLAYTTSQADFEISRLINTVALSDTSTPDEAEEDLFIRFEVALGRLIGLTEGSTGTRILANDQVRDIVLSVIQTLKGLEQDILNYQDLSPDAQNAVKATLHDASEAFHRATVTIALLGDQDQKQFFSSLADAARFEILMLGLIVVAAGLAYGNAYLERRRFVRLNAHLSDKVAERTAELEAFNAKLKDDVLEKTRAEERFRSMVDHATEAIVILDVDKGTYIEANPRAEALYGIPAKKLISGYGPGDLSPEFQPDGRRSDEASMAYVQEALDGDFPTFEWVHRSVDGIDVPCQVSLARFQDPTRQLVRGSIIDLTEQKQAEASQLALEVQLTQAQKLESIGQISGGVAHDFNNLLSVILGNMELLLDDTDDPDRRELITAAINASMRGAALTRSMLNFARRAHLQPEKIALNDTVRNMDNWISRTIPASIRIERAFQPDLWPILADVAATESALLNLVVNARDAMPDGGVLVIETENVEIDKTPDTADAHGLEPGRYAMLAISDTGSGISPADLAKVFDPFFTTKSQTQNSGLGLSMVLGFMTQSGGNARIYSEPGMGTTVKLFFPCTDAKPDLLDQHEDHGQDAAVEPARILVAEDQEDVLAILRRSLESQGHEVIAAGSGDAAAVLFTNSLPIDLLVTDIVMPGKLQGPGLAKHLREVQPDLPVIFMSGYASEATLHGNGLRRDDIRLMKPVARKKLIKSIGEALQGRAN